MYSHILSANEHILEESEGFGFLDLHLLYTSSFWHTGAGVEK